MHCWWKKKHSEYIWTNNIDWTKRDECRKNIFFNFL